MFSFLPPLALRLIGSIGKLEPHHRMYCRRKLPERAERPLVSSYGMPNARSRPFCYAPSAWTWWPVSNPTAEWIASQVTEAFPWDEAPQHLIRDRDDAFGDAYTHRVRAMGIHDHPTAPRSPWQKGHVERLIGSIRRECLDHMIVLGEAHLRRVLKEYAAYYNQVRTHLSFDKNECARVSMRAAGRHDRVSTRVGCLASSICTSLSFRQAQQRVFGHRLAMSGAYCAPNKKQEFP